MIKRILIANRGEIACRIARTCKDIGITVTGIYSPVDTGSLHTRTVNQAIALKNRSEFPGDPYLDIDQIIEIAKKHNIDAIHPGYGFLSENANFSAACKNAGIIFIGPSPETITLAGDKIQSKELARSLNIPIIAEAQIEENQQNLKKLVENLRFPLLVKAAGGGGGRGMRRVDTPEDLKEAIQRAQDEAGRLFGNSKVYIEQFIENPRHVEVQIFGDQSGEVIHFFDRDCSAQRRHQKVIEEAPATAIPNTVRKSLFEAAKALGSACNYHNAGTVEFLVTPDNEWFFLEINSRLQVEHPVTEAITGLDLVKLQIQLAEGKLFQELDIREKNQSSGHAIELRVCAEDPYQDFLPDSGILQRIDFPVDSGVRIDSGFENKDRVSHSYDSLLAKIIVSGPSREAVIKKTKAAIQQTRISGVQTNLPTLSALLHEQEFMSGTHSTSIMEKVLKSFPTDQQFPFQLLAVLARNIRPGVSEPWKRGSGWRLSGSSSRRVCMRACNTLFDLIVRSKEDTLRVQETSHQENNTSLLVLRSDGKRVCFKTDAEEYVVEIDQYQNTYWVHDQSGSYRVETLPLQGVLKEEEEKTQAENGIIQSPLPGVILDITCKEESQVSQDQTLIVLESMKMEHPITTPGDAIVKSIHVQKGETVSAGQVLVTLHKA